MGIDRGGNNIEEEILVQIRDYLVSKKVGDNTSEVNTTELEKGNLIQSKLNPGNLSNIFMKSKEKVRFPMLI